MIDSETKKKIIKLYNDGNSKTFISKNMEVSLPTIRAILKKADMNYNINEEKYSVESPSHKIRLNNIEENFAQRSEEIPEKLPNRKCLNTVDVFTVNTTKNSPDIGVSPYDRLRNGVPCWALQNNLHKIFSDEITIHIIDGIKNTGNSYGIFRVVISNSLEEPRVDVAYISRWGS